MAQAANVTAFAERPDAASERAARSSRRIDQPPRPAVQHALAEVPFRQTVFMKSQLPCGICTNAG